MTVAKRDVLDDLARYVGFGPADHQVLRTLADSLAPSLPAIADRFYDEVMREPKTALIIQDPEQTARLKVTLRDWLVGIFGGTYDDAYFERRARIGRMHVRIGLEQRFMFGAMNILRVGMHEATRASGLPKADRPTAHAAIDKICDIELGIMLETYREAYVLRQTAESETMAAMGRLTAGLAHEIRNPLNAAKLQLEVLDRNATGIENVEHRDQVQRRVAIVKKELGRLSELLDDFLSLARPREIKAQSLDVLKLIEDVAELESPAATQHGVTLEVEVGSTLPAVYADPARIRQVLVNLVANAFEATRGKPDGRVRLVAEGNADHVEIRVEDNGPGLDASVAGRIFQSFVTTKDAGTGLGLTIVKNIVERHGGTVEIVSGESGGATARFTLPRA